MARTEQLLRDWDVLYRKMTYHGIEYLAWDEGYDQTADAVLELLSPRSLGQLREIRARAVNN
ncbi:MAG: hypothetical protein ACREV2_03750 [Burkholderiales bacterium]